MKSMAYMTLRLVVATLLLSRSMGDEQRINYGVIFQKHLNIDFATIIGIMFMKYQCIYI